ARQRFAIKLLELDVGSQRLFDARTKASDVELLASQAQQPRGGIQQPFSLQVKERREQLALSQVAERPEQLQVDLRADRQAGVAALAHLRPLLFISSSARLQPDLLALFSLTY